MWWQRTADALKGYWYALFGIVVHWNMHLSFKGEGCYSMASADCCPVEMQSNIDRISSSLQGA